MTQPTAVPVLITWDELLRTPDRKLRHLIAERWRESARDARTPPADRAGLKDESAGPPDPDEIDNLRASIATLADRARRIRKAKNDDAERPYRDELNRMIDAEAARLEAVAAWRYEQMARDYTTRIRHQQQEVAA